MLSGADYGGDRLERLGSGERVEPGAVAQAQGDHVVGEFAGTDDSEIGGSVMCPDAGTEGASVGC